MLARRRHRRAPLLTYVVDPYSAVARDWVPAVRELALVVGDHLPIEVVCTGDRSSLREDSLAAGAGVHALLATERLHPVTVVEDVLRAFADHGADIADPSTIAELAAARRLDRDAVKLVAASDDARAMAREDRELARGLGDPAGAALLYAAGDRLHRLPGPGSTPRELVSAWRTLAPTSTTP